MWNRLSSVKFSLVVQFRENLAAGDFVAASFQFDAKCKKRYT